MNIYIDTDAVIWGLVAIAALFGVRALYRKWRWWSLKRDVRALTDLIGIKSPLDD